MALTTTQIPTELLPGLHSMLTMPRRYPSQYTEIYKTIASERKYEFDIEMRMLGPASLRPEGGITASDDMGERFKTTYVMQDVALSTTITADALMDNQYQDMFPKQGEAIRNSLHETKETLGSSLLNNGFNPAYVIGDGQPLFSLTHPTDVGFYANMFDIPVELSEAGIEQAIITISQYTDQAGLLVQTKALKLLVPPALGFTADRLLNSQFRVDTNENTISAIYNLKSIPEGSRINHYFSNPTAWFIITDATQGFKHFERMKVKSKVYAEPSTDNVICSGWERYTFGTSNARCCFGSGNFS